MSLMITAGEASEVAPGIWSFQMAPHQVRLLGSTNHALGEQSIILLSEARYDAAARELQFPWDRATPINIGTTSAVVGFGVSRPEHGLGVRGQKATPAQNEFGPGDREFLQLAQRELSDGTSRAAEALLLGVRSRSAGDLKRGQSRNFSETPDNFWYVIVQPRADELSITVRGSTEHFSPVAKLEIKDDRGNTRFKVGREADVPAALDLIFHARRKR